MIYKKVANANAVNAAITNMNNTVGSANNAGGRRNKVVVNAKSANAENNNITCLFETNSPPTLDPARIKAMNDQIDE